MKVWGNDDVHRLLLRIATGLQLGELSLKASNLSGGHFFVVGDRQVGPEALLHVHEQTSRRGDFGPFSVSGGELRMMPKAAEFRVEVVKPDFGARKGLRLSVFPRDCASQETTQCPRICEPWP